MNFLAKIKPPIFFGSISTLRGGGFIFNTPVRKSVWNCTIDVHVRMLQNVVCSKTSMNMREISCISKIS